MRFIEDWLPLLVVLQKPRFDETEMQELTAGYERYFRRNERYAVLTVSPSRFVQAGAKERKLVADWLNDPRVREISERLCVGSANVVPSAIARGAMTALMWLWKPPAYFQTTSTVEDGIDLCVDRLLQHKVPLRTPTERLRPEVVERLRALGGFESSLRPRDATEP